MEQLHHQHDDRCANPRNYLPVSPQGPPHGFHPKMNIYTNLSEKNIYFKILQKKIYILKFQKKITKIKSPLDDSDSGPAARFQTPKIFWVIIFMTEQLVYASCSQAQAGVQWLATPLSQHGPYWARLQGLIKSLNSALHGFEPTTSRSLAQCYTPKPTGWCVFSPDSCIYTPKHVKLS